jgi:hypothetical protein
MCSAAACRVKARACPETGGTPCCSFSRHPHAHPLHRLQSADSLKANPAVPLPLTSATACIAGCCAWSVQQWQEQQPQHLLNLETGGMTGARAAPAQLQIRQDCTLTGCRLALLAPLTRFCSHASEQESRPLTASLTANLANGNGETEDPPPFHPQPTLAPAQLTRQLGSLACRFLACMGERSHLQFRSARASVAESIVQL